MSATELLDQVKGLPETERNFFYQSLLKDQELREDLLDSITIETRRSEGSQSLEEVLSDLGIRL